MNPDMSDYVPNILLQSPSGQRIDLSSPYLSGGDFSPSDDYYPVDGTLYNNVYQESYPSESYEVISLPTSTYDDYSDTQVPSDDYTPHPYGLPHATPPLQNYRSPPFRSPATPSDDELYQTSPFLSPSGSSPNFNADAQRYTAAQSPHIGYTPEMTEMVSDMGDVIIGDYLPFTGEHSRIAPSALFSSYPNDLSFDAENWVSGGLSGHAEEESLDSLKDSTITVRAHDYSPSSSAVSPYEVNAEQVFTGSPAPPPPVRANRFERHSFSGNADLQLLRAEAAERTRPRSSSAPTTPPCFSPDLPTLSTALPSSSSSSTGTSVGTSMTHFESGVTIAKPVVTTDAMKEANYAKRKNPPAFKCPYCSDSFTTNFSRKRHINSHTKQASFTCTRGCSKVFRNASDCKRHERKQHG